MIYTQLTDRIDRAARAGRSLSIDAGLVRALVAHPAYAMLAESRVEELVRSWEEQEARPPSPEPRSDPSGSGIAPSATNGASVGTTTAAEAEAVGRAESRRASEAVTRVTRRRRQKTASPITMPPGASPSSRPPQQHSSRG